jgi:alanine dehydrogenase
MADHRAVLSRADMIVKVKEPQPSEYPLLRKGQILFTYLHLAADKSLTEGVARSGVTGLAYETIEVNRRLAAAGADERDRRAHVDPGGWLFPRKTQRRQRSAAGRRAGRAARQGRGARRRHFRHQRGPHGYQGMGADVTILEVDLERMRFLDITLHTAHTLYSNEAHLMELLPNVDLLIGAVLVPGARAPKLINREMLRRMRPGSVLVDIAIDQGGCVETSRPTSHDHPVYVEEGVTHYCVANMPGAFARTATQALTNVTYRYIELIADLGLVEACQKQPALLGGINVMDGKITHKAVAEAHGLPYSPPALR